MSKAFLEVFPGLKLNKEQHELFDDTQILRCTTNSRQDLLRVYLSSSHLIPHSRISDLEQKIAKELFSGRLTVRVIERFSLPAVYNLKNLYEAYESSLMAEIRVYSPLLHSILKNARITFRGECGMEVEIEDTVPARERTEELYEILEKILCERCSCSAQIHITYREKEESLAGKNAQIQLKNEIRMITMRLSEHPEGADAADEVSAALTDAAADASSWTAGPDGTVKKTGSGPDGAAKKTESGPAASKSTASRGRTNEKTRQKTGSANKTSGGRKPYRSEDPDIVYGRWFQAEEVTPISQLDEGSGQVVVRGQIIHTDQISLRNEKKLLIYSITDFTDTIDFKLFAEEADAQEISANIKKGGFYQVKAVVRPDRYDGELTLASIGGIKKIPDFTEHREDTYPQKRVELHCHTKMSDMDGVSDVGSIIKRAASWGHRAIAITDHGDVQAFPDAMHTLEGLDGDFKVIYGVEAYLVDDLKGLVTSPAGQSFADTFVVFDLETTGLSATSNRIIEIGAVKVQNGAITDRFSTFVNPEVPIPYRIEQLTSISNDMVADAPLIETALPEFMEFSKDAVMVAHNAEFDMSFIEKNCLDQGIPCKKTVLDTVMLARHLLPRLNRFKLDTVAKELGVPLLHHHRAVDDAACTAEIFVKMIGLFAERGIHDLDALAECSASDANMIRKLPSYHAIILAKNEIGRVNLYRLVSDSHLHYFQRRPRIPKSALNEFREGLILGSACEAGELYQALLSGRPEQEIARIVSFYDYLEIQPLGNNAFMIPSDKHAVESEEDLKEYNRKIVRLGKAFDKPVVATCDVHFLDPQDEVYRRIIMAGKGFSDADNQAPLFLRTTQEMLDEFAYLGSDTAQEVVITNTNRIADMCEQISPVRPDKCPPIIENSDQMLRDICYAKAHEIYGEQLPDVVTERLERELNSIISNGFAVMYIIAQKLVWKSNEDGYLVGSRGSVGSSFVATMAGITEVNPLSPHYLCPECHYVDFDSEEVRAYAGKAGCDMPDKDCPVCGHSLNKLGFDIPFETFLGFKGNKEPDIDLNFSGEYQSKAHKYTEVIFGDGQTFRAGTIGTLAEKTAFGYVKKYYEERHIHKRNAEIDRIVSGCVNVRRTTGQHPGGIIVLPLGENIYSFTPIQHPADDMNTDIITTHFDYHSIDHNLLKLDILGHDDPTMIRLLQDLTGIDPLDIPLDNPEVMSLFQNTKALGVEPDDIMGCTLGALGIPEFGTDFAMQMLIDTKPTAFSDLVRIAGLSHGTDVWIGNAKTLLEEGKATISTAICTRDDIMTYLIGKGVDSEESFNIMENVRKGKVAGKKCKNWDEWKADMQEHGVPDWYIWSCERIQYMFPKAHAVAYVMMAWRIAYCKVFYPLAYYAAFFSVRATAFDYEKMCMGQERVEYHIRDLRSREDSLKEKEKDLLRDISIVQEMYARGFSFLPIDLYRAKAKRFQIIDGKLMPSFSSISGMGDKAAAAVEEAAKDGPYLSKDNFRERTRVSKTVIDVMSDLGIMDGLPESNQLSLFDF